MSVVEYECRVFQIPCNMCGERGCRACNGEGRVALCGTRIEFRRASDGALDGPSKCPNCDEEVDFAVVRETADGL